MGNVLNTLEADILIVYLYTVHYRLARVVQQATPNCPHAAARMNLTPNKQQIPFKQVSLILLLERRSVVFIGICLTEASLMFPILLDCHTVNRYIG